MGNYLPVIRSLLKRTSKPLREFNIEARAEKVVMKDKPTPAPRHPGTEKLIEMTDSPEITKNLFEMDLELMKRLEKVYVTSHDQDVLKSKTKSSESSRSMPASREYVTESSFGYHEPKRISYGKTTLKNALEFLAKSHQLPDEWNAPKIAETYKLDTKDTENVLKYFSTFVLVMPSTKLKVGQNIGEEAALNLGAHSIVQIPMLVSDPQKKSSDS